MTALALNVFNDFVFPQIKDQFLDKLMQKPPDSFHSVFRTIYEENTTKDHDLHCTCCGWKGKGSEAIKKCLFLDHATELELFCQSCKSNLGFIAIKK